MKSVKIAIGANLSVCILKFIVAFMGGSAAMFAEAIHSLADTCNQALLMVGLTRSKIGPSKKFPFGRGQERFVWGLISACGIFFVGAGVTIYHGIHSLKYPHAPEVNSWTVMVLLYAFLAEGYSLLVAWRSRKQGDTANLAVVMEDGVAVIGLVFAAIAIALTYYTGNYYWDAIGSIVIGIMLGGIAIFLVWANLEYLIERASPQEMQRQVKDVLLSFPLVEEIKDIRMIVITPESHYVRAEVEFNGYLLIREMAPSLKEDYEEINDYGEFLQFCASFANRVTRTVGLKIDEMEAQLKEECPFIKHVDIKPS